jgi:CheY-like chemotaxis protein
VHGSRRYRRGTFSPDVALLELALANVDGLEVARHLRERGVIPIALTGYSDTPHRLQAAQAGFVFYLVKPVAIEDLEAVLYGCGEPPTARLGSRR